MKTVAKQRVWPIEVNRSMVLQGGKGKAKEEELVTSFHGVAYVDMAPLLYPGVKKIRGAYLVKPFSELDLTEKTGRKGTLMDDANKLITSTRSSSSIAHAKVPAGKGNKFDGKPKVSEFVLTCFNIRVLFPVGHGSINCTSLHMLVRGRSLFIE